MPKIIYVLTNEAMPNLVKIGFTDSDVEARMTELSRASGVPLAFECYFAAEVTDATKLEKNPASTFCGNARQPEARIFPG